MNTTTSSEETFGLILSCTVNNYPEKWKRPALSEIDETDENILIHLTQGLTAKEISKKIYVSIPNIKYRIGKMLKLTGAKNAKQLVYKMKAA